MDNLKLEEKKNEMEWQELSEDDFIEEARVERIKGFTKIVTGVTNESLMIAQDIFGSDDEEGTSNFKKEEDYKIK